MREGLETPAPDGRSADPARTGSGDRSGASDAGPSLLAERSSPSVPWRALGIWFLLAAASVWFKVRYTSGSGAGALSASDAGPGGVEGAIDTALGVLGCVMILVGALAHRFVAGRGGGLRRPLTVNVSAWGMGAVLVTLAAGTPQFAIFVSLSVLAASLATGVYLTGWLPEMPGGTPLAVRDLTSARQAVLQRLWTMTDVAPERIETLLGRDFPVRNPGGVDALRRSLRSRFRPVRTQRRDRAAVDILQVPPPAIEEAVQVVSQHGRLFALERLHGPMSAMHRGWLGLHLGMSVLAATVIAGGLFTGVLW